MVFSSLEDAVRTHPEIVQKYLHKLVTPNKDKFAALHTAFWSGGVFLYVPEGVTVEAPSTSYTGWRRRARLPWATPSS